MFWTAINRQTRVNHKKIDWIREKLWLSLSHGRSCPSFICCFGPASQLLLPTPPNDQRLHSFSAMRTKVGLFHHSYLLLKGKRMYLHTIRVFPDSFSTCGDWRPVGERHGGGVTRRFIRFARISPSSRSISLHTALTSSPKQKLLNPWFIVIYSIPAAAAVVWLIITKPVVAGFFISVGYRLRVKHCWACYFPPLHAAICLFIGG